MMQSREYNGLILSSTALTEYCYDVCASDSSVQQLGTALPHMAVSMLDTPPPYISVKHLLPDTAAHPRCI